MNNNTDIVHLNDIHDIDFNKLRPSDLNKRYIDRNGQEWKLRYNRIKDVIQIVRIVRDTLDGDFIKSRYDTYDNTVQDAVKKTMADYAAKKVGLNDVNTHDKQQPHQSDTVPHDPVQSSDDSLITDYPDIFTVLSQMEKRLQIVERNIMESRVFDPRLNARIIHAYDEVSRYMRSTIYLPIHEIEDRVHDIEEGREDYRIRNKQLSDEEHALIERIENKDSRLEYLRRLQRNEFVRYQIDSIQKGIEQVIEWMDNVDKTEMNVRPNSERQHYNDALISLNTSREQITAIVEYLDKDYHAIYE